MARTVLIMAGGTGGHVFPALAAARVLRERGFEPVWLGTQRGLEAKLVPPQQIPIEWISVSGVRGKGVTTLLAAPFQLARAVWQSIQVMRRRQPVVVLGAGGFVSGPGGIAAWLTRRPLVIHEQNAVAGMTNKMLARLAQRVFEAFPSSFPKSIKAERVGNPVRREIAALPPPEKRFAERRGPLRVLIIGGSQGASRLNVVVPAALAMIDTSLRPQVLHQAGERHIAQARESYEKHGVEADVRAFIDDMAEAYAWADLVICRSGALTVSELAAAGVPAVFVPFAAAVDDHQTHNARFPVAAGAGVLIPEAELTPLRLANELRTLLEAGRTKLADMAVKARSIALTDADVRLADACVAAAGGAA
ncbi:MAG TPA: undecaprenyldiphospho-muramoylpentapeptide beta-N-acetylglucosaminyltransferase [Povalibacter sp.]|uniref:undecaprenyldiphospho-muramoylpentapeptide beta-N-acetylglucosaminyltransferase n=1 Tax=Povalibacter sp. TaxID=1962978 RepID=UPI002C67A03E|nr:undecaprenyldiphospho-muramoylpentapeptide beta-N-acetylglucosaminyltransferase [Povalibacter sp.]HMN45012.1 undecaprenyldiphospho-muramoylpentapeptide beta-N-acetylglucosaminyltransferase [Povalibacter sp.]